MFEIQKTYTYFSRHSTTSCSKNNFIIIYHEVVHNFSRSGIFQLIAILGIFHTFDLSCPSGLRNLVRFLCYNQRTNLIQQHIETSLFSQTHWKHITSVIVLTPIHIIVTFLARFCHHLTLSLLSAYIKHLFAPQQTNRTGRQSPLILEIESPGLPTSLSDPDENIQQKSHIVEIATAPGVRLCMGRGRHCV